MLPGGGASAARRSRRERAAERLRLCLNQQWWRVIAEAWRTAESWRRDSRSLEDAIARFAHLTQPAADEVRLGRRSAGLPRSIQAERAAAADATKRAILTFLGVEALTALLGGNLGEEADGSDAVVLTLGEEADGSGADGSDADGSGADGTD